MFELLLQWMINHGFIKSMLIFLHLNNLDSLLVSLRDYRTKFEMSLMTDIRSLLIVQLGSN